MEIYIVTESVDGELLDLAAFLDEEEAKKTYERWRNADDGREYDIFTVVAKEA
jgi:hypothetical protein